MVLIVIVYVLILHIWICVFKVVLLEVIIVDIHVILCLLLVIVRVLYSFVVETSLIHISINGDSVMGGLAAAEELL